MNRTAMIAIAIAMAAAPASGQNGNIGLFWDVQASTCQIDIPCNCSARLYVYALLQGTSAGGITGAEYKIRTGPNSNPDPGWVFVETFDPAMLVIGSGSMTPPDNMARGVNVAWAGCQQGDGHKVLLETVDILNVGCLLPQPLPLDLLVVKHDTTSNPLFQCPAFTLCDAPVYTQVCIGSNLTTCPNPEPPFPNNATCSTGGRTWINPDPMFYCCLSCPIPAANCTIGVESKAWSGVKALYRD